MRIDTRQLGFLIANGFSSRVNSQHERLTGILVNGHQHGVRIPIESSRPQHLGDLLVRLLYSSFTLDSDAVGCALPAATGLTAFHLLRSTLEALQIN